ncbi:MAG: PD-(D/E)XK nuclease family protein [Caldisericaceae bacterium]
MEEKNTFYLSYSKISTYIKCPLRYKFIYVDKLPTEVKPYFSLGNSVHKVLEKFYSPNENFIVLKKLPFQYLLELFEENWISDGYKTQKEENNAKEKAKKMLIGYYKKHIFGFKPAYEVETNFSFPFLGVEMKGRLDRVDMILNNFIIIDYKTNSFLEDSFREEEILQPIIYNMAGNYKYGAGRIKKVSFHYLSKGKNIEFEISNYMMEKSKRKIGEILDNISKGVYPPKINGTCESCEFKKICEAYALSKLSHKLR